MKWKIYIKMVVNVVRFCVYIRVQSAHREEKMQNSTFLVSMFET